jgi:release factor glutamine methyltransferase
MAKKTRKPRPQRRRPPAARRKTGAKAPAPPAREAAPALPPRIVPPVGSPFAPQPDTLTGWLGEAERRLAAAGIDSARLDAQVLVAAALGAEPGALRFAGDRPVGSREGQRIENFLRRRAKTREPVSRILGRREFWSLEFRITPAVLDPRPDSETLIEAALACFPDRAAPLAVLDLGTGSGCLLLAALHEYPHAAGLGIDASEKALAVAAENAERLGLGARAQFARGDWGRDLGARFDLVLCNPPYIAEGERASLAPEVARHDPPAALFAGADGLDAYREILPDLPRLLAPGGTALFEMGASQAAAVSGLARAAGLAVADIRPDLAGRERCAVLKVA